MKNEGRAEGQHALKSNCPTQQAGSGERETGLKPGFPSPTAIGLPLELPPGVTQPKEFEQLPRESTKAYAAFRTYLDLGPERSLALAAAKLGKSKVLMERWSRKYDWTGRVMAHAAYAAQAEREAIERLARERAIEWHKVHEDQRIQEWKRRTRLLALADEMIARWEANPNRYGTLEGIARLLELASKLGRLASGMETEGVGSGGATMAGVRVEVSVALEKIYGKPLPGEVVEVEAKPVKEITEP